MIRLHFYPGNASLAPHLLLRELGVPFELQLVDRTQAAHKAPAYLALNPNGQIPVLEDGELVLYETAAILLHLADRFPQARLAPLVGTPERAQYYKWMVWLTNTLQAMLMHYFYPERIVRTMATPLRRPRCAAQAEARIGPMLQQLDDLLAGHAGPWLLGADYSAVDPLAFTLCRWTRGFAGQPARSYPHIGPYLQRMLARPAVQQVFEVEGLAAPWV